MRSTLLRARHRVSRLTRMPPPEIRHRVKEALRVGVDRATGALGRHPTIVEPLAPDIRDAVAAPGAASADEDAAALRYLQQVAARRFYLPFARDGWARLHNALELHVPGAVPRALAEAESLADGCMPLLGHGRVPVGAEVDWHRDPFDHTRWPVRFWADYDLVADDNVADPKGIHELNRHQHLPRLAIAYALSGHHRFARHALRHMDSWIDQNPPGRGVNWSSSLEIALRVVSWLWTVLPLATFGAVEPPMARKLLASLRDQLRHIARYPSVYSSPNTHLLGEATALFVGGVVLAELPEADSWRDAGRRFLVEEIGRQVLPDGAHAELSSCYHCYSLDFYLQALALARRNGLELSPDLDERVVRAAQFVQHLTRADGTLPLLGDDDGGRALALDRQDYRSFTDGLSTAAVLFERPDLATAARGLHAETLWLLGADAGEVFRDMLRQPRQPQPETSVRASDGSSAPPGGSRFPHSGYCVQRAGTSHLVFDCGDLGRLGGGHGHADALSIVLHHGSTEMLVDPGTYAYNLAPRWRDRFRSTRAHNTLVVDSADQAVPAGTFGWASELTAKIRDRRSWPGLDLIEGEHDGYRRLARPVVHRRRVLLVDNEYWLIFDDVRGSGDHRYDLYYHLAPEVDIDTLRLQPMGDRGIGLPVRAGDDSLGLWVAGTASLEPHVEHGQIDPPGGWVSRRYGARTPAPTLRARMRAGAPAGFVSALLPDPGDAAVTVPASGSDGSQAAALRIERRDTEDLALLAPDGRSAVAAELEAVGELVWLRLVNGEPRRLLARNATRVAWRDTVLLDSDRPKSWFEWARPGYENGS